MTQNQAIPAHLEAGHNLTALEALHKFKTMRLAARVAELRARGARIESELVSVGVGKKVALYRLSR
jgi:hypothetical protein